MIWNWPTLGDRVWWVVGFGIAVTHQSRRFTTPPRGDQRSKPHTCPDKFRDKNQDQIRAHDPNRHFASGDGGALMNNRRTCGFVERVPMADRDYTFTASHPLPRPTEPPPLRKVAFWEVKHPGDTFRASSVSRTSVRLSSPASSHHQIIPQVRMRCLGRSKGSRRCCSSTHCLSRLEQPGTKRVPAGYGGGTPSLLDLRVNDSEDFGDGEYRIFAAVDSDYLFLNELPGDDNILDDGLGDTGGDETEIPGRHLTLSYRPVGIPNPCRRMEADGVDELFGSLVEILRRGATRPGTGLTILFFQLELLRAVALMTELAGQHCVATRCEEWQPSPRR